MVQLQRPIHEIKASLPKKRGKKKIRKKKKKKKNKNRDVETKSGSYLQDHCKLSSPICSYSFKPYLWGILN
jgi:hypothetical protein